MTTATKKKKKKRRKIRLASPVTGCLADYFASHGVHLARTASKKIVVRQIFAEADDFGVASEGGSMASDLSVGDVLHEINGETMDFDALCNILYDPATMKREASRINLTFRSVSRFGALLDLVNPLELFIAMLSMLVTKNGSAQLSWKDALGPAQCCAFVCVAQCCLRAAVYADRYSASDAASSSSIEFEQSLNLKPLRDIAEKVLNIPLGDASGAGVARALAAELFPYLRCVRVVLAYLGDARTFGAESDGNEGLGFLWRRILEMPSVGFLLDDARVTNAVLSWMSSWANLNPGVGPQTAHAPASGDLPLVYNSFSHVTPTFQFVDLPEKFDQLYTQLYNSICPTTGKRMHKPLCVCGGEVVWC